MCILEIISLPRARWRLDVPRGEMFGVVKQRHSGIQSTSRSAICSMCSNQYYSRMQNVVNGATFPSPATMSHAKVRPLGRPHLRACFTSANWEKRCDKWSKVYGYTSLDPLRGILISIIVEYDQNKDIPHPYQVPFHPYFHLQRVPSPAH